MRAVPAFRDVITPLFETVATTSLSLLQVSVRPVFESTLFAVSRSVITGCACAVTVTFCVVGDSEHAPIGMFVTVSDALPMIPSASAAMTTLPGVRAITLPV